jgi:hypothetical protein
MILQWPAPASSREEAEPIVQHVRIVSVSGKESIVETPAGDRRPAQTAFSCLVRPMPGDLVLCTRTETGMSYILGIIDRPEEQHMTLAFPGDATMLSDAGSLAVYSAKSVTLAAGDRLDFISDKAVHKSREAVVDFEELAARGKNLQATFSTVRIVSHVVSTFAKQVLQKAVDYIRHTEDCDQVKAGQMTRKAAGLYSMDSEYTVMVSKKDTKIDGERIHMG